VAIADGFSWPVGCRMCAAGGFYASHAYSVVFTDTDRYAHCYSDTNADYCGYTSINTHRHTTTDTYRGRRNRDIYDRL
jgi:hypothetical protein